MKVIVAMVMSVDGKTTKWDETNIYTWTSPEDQKQFFSLIEESNAIAMGRKTYSAAKHLIKLSPLKLRIILTQKPELYEDIPGQLEFRSNPKEIVENVKQRGYKQLLLVSGTEVTTAFLKENLVDELWLTVEPKLFGSGNALISPEKRDLNLQLLSIKKLNKRGTLILKYKII